MNILQSPNIINLKSLIFLSDIEVGKHLYWEINDITFHGQVIIVSSFVILLTLLFSFLGTSNKNIIPNGWQNFMESVVEFVKEIAQNQLGDEYRPWLPFIGTLFLFVFGCCPIFFRNPS